jgi:hypothetical protein
METIRLAIDDLGEIVTVTCYADFDNIDRNFGGPGFNWQRELAIAGSDTRYVINQHGKNTADMKIADDIRTLVENNAHAYTAIDIIGLVTMDRDFRYVVETARSRGMKVVVLGLEGQMSRELRNSASDVRYLDALLKSTKANKSDEEKPLRVFLCHSSNDKRPVRTLYQRLCADKIAAWLDEEELIAGQDWDREIKIAVRACDIVIVCLSNGSITKEGYVQKEIKYALDVADEQPEGSIFLIPVRLEECVVPERLKKWHWVDLFTEQGYDKLLRGIKSCK